MHFKLILAFVEDSKTTAVMNAAREEGATGATVINNARGEGLSQKKTLKEEYYVKKLTTKPNERD